MTTTTVYLMTGDIGGTNSRMSLYESNTSCCKNEPLFEKKFRNHEALPDHVRSDPNAFCKYIIIPFLEYCWQQEQQEQQEQDSIKKKKLVPLDHCTIFCCLATAGVVHENQVEMTNLGNLRINGNAIQAYHKEKSEMDDPSLVNNPYLSRIVQCHIVNDFVAQGYGCLTLTQADVQHLHGPSIPPQDLIKGPKVCVGAGTGLGECYLTQSMGEGMYTCFPSEGGHVEYAARNDVEVALFHYLNDKFATKHRISIERVVSGTGLANVYEFLAQYYPTRVDATFDQAFMLAVPDEKPALVSQRAHEEVDNNIDEKTVGEPKEPSLCQEAMNIMMSAYGCEVGSAAIKWIPTGGLFVTGGLTPKNMQFIAGEQTEFMQSYLHKGRVSTLLQRIPLYAVTVEDLGVRGAHKAAQMAFERYQREHNNNGTMQTTTNNKNSSTRSSGGGGGFGCGVLKCMQGEWQPWCMTVMATAALGFAVGAAFAKKNIRLKV